MLETLTLAAHQIVPDGVGAAPGWVAAIPFLPIAGVVICAICAAMGVKSKLPAIGVIGSLAMSFLMTVAAFGSLRDQATVVNVWEWFTLSWGDQPGQTFIANFSFYFDNVSLLWMLFVTGLGTLIAVYASEYMEHDQGPGYCRFFAAFGLFVFSMACLVMGGNMLMLYLGWEGVGLCSYLLIGYYYKKPEAVAAAKKAFIVNRIGDLGLAIGVFLTFVHFGTLEYSALFQSPLLNSYLTDLQDGALGAIPLQAQLIAVFLMIGAFGKSAQFPLYVWLPDAMEGPTPVSALIHAATMVTAGLYLIARFYPIFLISEWALPIVAWIGTITALLAATIGMAQFDIKRIMAYSTVSQLGYMFAGLAVLSSTGGVFHVLTHAFFKALLFLCCGAVMHGFAGQLDLRKLSGLWTMKGWRVVSIGMLVGCLNLAGFPFLTAGFYSKDMILAEAFVTPGPGYQWIGWILLVTAGMTAYYTFRVFFRVFVGPEYYEPGDEHHGDDHAHEPEPGSEIPAHHGPDHDHDHGHGGFHPHAPGLAINGVLATLSVCAVLAAGLYYMKTDRGSGGWIASMIQGPNSSAAMVEWKGEDSHGGHDHGHEHGDDHSHDDGGGHAAADDGLTLVAYQPEHGEDGHSEGEHSDGEHSDDEHGDDHSGDYGASSESGSEIPTHHGDGHDDHGHGDGGHGHHARPVAAFLLAQTSGEDHEYATTLPPTGTFLGQDPHNGIMYYVSGVIGIGGVLLAAFLHGPKGLWGLGVGGRTTAGVCRMDPIARGFGPIPKWAENKWYVDEFYDFLFRTPLWVLSHIFHLLDRGVVGGIVWLFGRASRFLGSLARPWQNGVLQTYAFGMAGGVALFVVLIVAVML